MRKYDQLSLMRLLYIYFDVIHSNLYVVYYQAWRFLAYVLVHAGWVHICSNIIGKNNSSSLYKIMENEDIISLCKIAILI